MKHENVHIFINHTRIAHCFICDEMKPETRFYSQNKPGRVLGTPSALPQCQRLWRRGDASPDISATSPTTQRCLWNRSRNDFQATSALVNGPGIALLPHGRLPEQCFCKAKSLIVGCLTLQHRVAGPDEAPGMVLGPYRALSRTRAFFRRTVTGESNITPSSKLTDLCAGPHQCRHSFCVPLRQ